ncbi:MAG: DUF3305 domain-containing protein [Gammaproteobacteria bacterium]
MKSSLENAFAPARIAISIILERCPMQRGRWSFIDWRVVGAVAGQAFAEAEPKCALVHSDGQHRQYLWSGFHLSLYKDSAESYWYNLVGKQPSLFVVCTARDGHEMAPLMVSAKYDEAADFMETGTKVFATPMPPEVYRWLEDYVLQNYEPQEPKKRMRRKWGVDHDQP